MLKYLLVALLLTGGAQAQDATAQAQAMALIAQATQVIAQAQAPASPALTASAVFVDKVANDACARKGIVEACEIRDRVDHAMAVEEVLNDKCRDGSGDDPDTMKACDLRDAIGKELNARGYRWNDGSDAQGNKVADGHWKLSAKHR